MEWGSAAQPGCELLSVCRDQGSKMVVVFGLDFEN